MAFARSMAPVGRRWRAALVWSALCAAIAGGGPAALAQPAAPLSCDDTLKTRFKPDARTTVLLVRQLRKGDPLLSPERHLVRTDYKVAGADLCLVKLLVGPGNPGPAGAPSTSQGIGIEVWLPAPDKWNGRIHATGNGGWAGTSESRLDRNSEAGVTGSFLVAPEIAATEGAVTSSTDTGHTSFMSGAFGLNPDGSINTVLWEDFAGRSLKEQAEKTQALATAYYGRAPRYRYFDASSTGGRQGLKLAQQYPDLYDGIIAGAPAIYWSRFNVGNAYAHLMMERELGDERLSDAQLDAVSNAAIEACDVVGDVHLGYIPDPAACRYDPSRDQMVLCARDGGRGQSPTCLTRAQALAVNRLWYGMTRDGTAPEPSRDNGWDSDAGTGNRSWYGLPRGTKLTMIAGQSGFPISLEQVAITLGRPSLAPARPGTQPLNGASPWKSLSHADLVRAYHRGLELQPRFGRIDTDDPDLSAFRARGGKLILWHGVADEVIPVQGSIHYYKQVEERMGGFTALQEFSRFYVIPGRGHNPSQGTSNPQADPPLPGRSAFYDIMTAWVEKGERAPDSVRAASATQSAPICAFPARRTYISGDPKRAESYVCR